MSWRYPRDILHRKLRYLKTLASEDGIETSMERWLALLKEIQLEISWEVVYRTLLDLYLHLDLGIDWEDFDWSPDDWGMPDDWEMPPDWDWTPPDDDDWVNPFDPNDDADTVGKAYYDLTNYNLSYYDPPEIATKDIERFAWNQRYAISEKDTAEYKQMSLSLKTRLESHKQPFKDAGITPRYVDRVEEILSQVESRILRGFFVGFSVVGISRVAKQHNDPDPFRAMVDTRRFENWKAILPTESVVSWESIVGWTRVGYNRVGIWTMYLQKWLSDAMVVKINAFWLRSGLVSASDVSRYGGIDFYRYVPEQYTQYLPGDVKTLWQRVFMLQRVDQYHYTGGKHQLKMQFNIKRIRPILDRHGVIANIRGVYTCFANELLYRDYKGHKLYKQWKTLITDEDLVQKYLRMGCEESVLREVQGIVKP